MAMAASTGRLQGAETVNIADLIGGEPTGEHVDIEKMAPHSALFVNDEGEVIDISKALLALISGGGSGGSGGTVSVTATKKDGITTLTINNNGRVQTVEVLDGIDGKNGQDGADGQPGADGKPGADGYSPVRGTDYWTDADIEAIHAYIDERILGGEW